MRNRLRQLLQTKEYALGPFVTMSDPAIVELVALAGDPRRSRTTCAQLPLAIWL